MSWDEDERPSYMALYRLKNREKMNATSRAYQKKKREEMWRARGDLDPQKLQELRDVNLLPDGRRGEEDDRIAASLQAPSMTQRVEALVEQFVQEGMEWEDAQQKAIGVCLDELQEGKW